MLGKPQWVHHSQLGAALVATDHNVLVYALGVWEMVYGFSNPLEREPHLGVSFEPLMRQSNDTAQQFAHDDSTARFVELEADGLDVPE